MAQIAARRRELKGITSSLLKHALAQTVRRQSSRSLAESDEFCTMADDKPLNDADEFGDEGIDREEASEKVEFTKAKGFTTAGACVRGPL